MTWPKGKGKWLLASFLILIVLNSFGWRMHLLCTSGGFFDFGSLPLVFFRILLTSVYIAAYVLLLVFIAKWANTLSAATAASDKNPVLLEPGKRSTLQRRAWTYLLDGLICGLLCGAVTIVLGVTLFSLTAGDDTFHGGREEQGLLPSLVMVVTIVLPTFYLLFKHTLAGKSLGKALTGIRVVDAATGMPIGVAKSVARNWVFLVPLMPLVELIVASCRADKRRLGDLMADTVVVRD
jgi:uncharacterized RDD family membrane protein YckC